MKMTESHSGISNQSYQERTAMRDPPPYSETYDTNSNPPSISPQVPTATVTLSANSTISSANRQHTDVESVFVTGYNWNNKKDRSLVTAYILACGLGFLGAHHFYIRSPRFGVLYLLTFGVFGVGWLTDICRLPYLVKRSNSRLKDPASYFANPEDRDVLYAYILWLPLGILGAHHYYLRRWKWAILYTFTAGCFGIGWMIDVARIPRLTNDCNKQLAAERLQTRQHGPRLKSIMSAYLFALPPLGLFGGHHYYLNRRGFGILYSFTCGLFMVGWLADLFRMVCLVKRINQQTEKDFTTASEGHLVLPDKKKYTDDAYVLHCSPLGILGAGQFYVGRPLWGVSYFFTFGFLTIGWMIDMFRIKGFVRSKNKELESNQNQVRIHYGHNTRIIIVTDGMVVSQGGVSGQAPVVLQANAITGKTSEPDEAPPSYDSIITQTTPGEATGGELAMTQISESSSDEHVIKLPYCK